ncbi:MAG: ATP-binding protein [Gammaproteobacteria bacterium]|jgi:signal transduction histidine kinase
MKQSIVAAVLAVVALGILIAMAIESRPVPANVHVAQNSLANALQVLAEDYQAITEALQTAWRDQRPPGEAVRALIERSRSGADSLSATVALIPGSASQLTRISNSLGRLTVALESAGTSAGSLVDDITAYTGAVTVVREQGPQIVQGLRDVRLDRAATNTFELVAGTLDFIEQPARERQQDLERLLATLDRDARIDANMPREMSRLRSAVRTIVDLRGNIESRLSAIGAARIDAAAISLNDAVGAAYTSTVIRIDRARLLLASYALILLGTVAVFGIRLRQSYRQTAAANDELQVLNESLEQRVQVRTQELENALQELRESQVQLVQAEKMSSLGQLVAGISHEINTPLLYLANNVELISERLQQLEGFVRRSSSAYNMRPGDFDSREKYQHAFAAALSELKQRILEEELDAAASEAKDLLEDCSDGLRDLTEMSQSLKDFSRLDRAPVGKFDVNAGLEKTLVIARNIVRNKAQISKHFGELPEIECSPSKMNQVFLNLITNAAQAIEGTGDIVLRTERRGEDEVAISISDTGCGIPSDIIDKVRDPFFTTKEVGSGTGLGLSIVDEIIRSHNGALEIESEPGKGSRFTVVLPVRHRPANESDAIEATPDVASDSPETLAEAV